MNVIEYCTAKVRPTKRQRIVDLLGCLSISSAILMVVSVVTLVAAQTQMGWSASTCGSLINFLFIGLPVLGILFAAFGLVLERFAVLCVLGLFFNILFVAAMLGIGILLAAGTPTGH